MGLFSLLLSESQKQMAYDVSMMRFYPWLKRKKRKSDWTDQPGHDGEGDTGRQNPEHPEIVDDNLAFRLIVDVNRAHRHRLSFELELGL